MQQMTSDEIYDDVLNKREKSGGEYKLDPATNKLTQQLSKANSRIELNEGHNDARASEIEAVRDDMNATQKKMKKVLLLLVTVTIVIVLFLMVVGFLGGFNIRTIIEVYSSQ